MAEKYGAKVRELMIKEMKDVFTGSKGFVFSSIENIKASDMDAFRKKIRQSGTRYMVVKNKLARIALEEAGIEGLSDVLEQKNITGMGIVEDDPVEIVKMLTDFAKEKKGFNVSKGYLDGAVLEAERVKELADLPGREQLLAMVVGTMNAPITGFVGVLSSVLRSLLYAVKAIKEKKESE
ncbi:MAG: 50S ribosomal protein L10 [Candidatus Omnitrophica bacterium]|nr:50S ribosomal protein L10 [Candidatus Omnitrophota bacterium]